MRKDLLKECHKVTHYRLKKNDPITGKLMVDPNAKLEEELIVRPTSEGIIWSTYKDVQSYRILPLLINRAKWFDGNENPFCSLERRSFLWQEGHTAHATRDEAIESLKNDERVC
jgi:prolyl-tRNA synthetase